MRELQQVFESTLNIKGTKAEEAAFVEELENGDNAFRYEWGRVMKRGPASKFKYKKGILTCKLKGFAIGRFTLHGEEYDKLLPAPIQTLSTDGTLSIIGGKNIVSPQTLASEVIGSDLFLSGKIKDIEFNYNEKDRFSTRHFRVEDWNKTEISNCSFNGYRYVDIKNIDNTKPLSIFKGCKFPDLALISLEINDESTIQKIFNEFIETWNIPGYENNGDWGQLKQALKDFRGTYMKTRDRSGFLVVNPKYNSIQKIAQFLGLKSSEFDCKTISIGQNILIKDNISIAFTYDGSQLTAELS